MSRLCSLARVLTRRTIRYRIPVFFTIVIGITTISGCNRNRPEGESESNLKTSSVATTSAKIGLQPLRQYSVEGRHLTFSRDGEHVAVAGADDIVYLWRASELSPASIRHLRGHRQTLHSCAFSPDGKQLLSAGGTIAVQFNNFSELKLWKVDSGSELDSLTGMKYPAQGTAFSPDGRYLAAATDEDTVVVWSTESRKEVQRLYGYRQSNYCYSVAWSPDSGRIAAAGSSGEIVIWQAATGEELVRLTGHSKLVSSISFDRSERRLLTSCWDGSVRVWDLASRQPLVMYPGHYDAVESACFSPDENFVVSGGWDKSIRVWSAQTGSELRVIESHSDHVNSTVFRPGHSELFSASRDGTVKVWDTRQLLGK